ncbi:PBP1A family penicillin-binding protein [Alsobacter sp. SYSU M60028]|uniref:peptidoglycan glycosyltransferase n=1 Tax=Alsobacter ponti TaxID=2962936 RepID=A0ABT1L9Q9_9HYPH|nr:PBP1A family penicillin-binding protein [Alsobacter ponti]MCP8937798.1 PBP1A family penicillin-binding protein [Alsobacter ponti]
MDFRGRLSAWQRFVRAFEAFDSWTAFTLGEAGRRLGVGWDRYSAFADRFQARGGKRLMADLACEGLTLGTVGLLFMLTLAIPAFREVGGDDWLKKQDLAVVFLDRYGNEVGRRGIRHDDSIALDDFPEHLIKAVLATEDRRFYEHFGIDFIGTARALMANARASGVVQGGSSLTQQLAKNLFLTNERSIERKVKEAFLAIWLEFHLTKNEILKLYLDRAYMGGGTFGASAAAEFYFGKSVKDINLAEAAMLAGLFKAPTKFAPHVNLPAARARAADVLDNLVDAGFMTAGQVYAARRNPATPVARKQEISPDYYLDWAFAEMKRLADDGKLGHDRVLTVKTALDTSIQKGAEASLESILRQYGGSYDASQAATVVMDPDGAVRAMVGGRDYGASQFNRATDALRQPGSSFKPFVYTTALLTGKFKPSTIVVDAPICIGNWCPSNYAHSYSGSIPLAVALAKSINTIPVRLSIAIGDGSPKAGRAKIVDTCRLMGLTTPLTDTVSLPIGAAEVTVLDMTASYAVFANGGKRADPYAAVEVRNSHGDVIFTREKDGPKAKTILPEGVIADMNSMLVKVVEEGTGRKALLPGIKVGGKTGTTNAYRDAWFVGFTGNLVAGVWFGNDDYSSTNKMTGGSLPAMAWHDMMAPAHQGMELRPLPGIAPAAPAVASASAASPAAPAEAPAALRPTVLNRRSLEALGGIETLLRNLNARRELLPDAASLETGTVAQNARTTGGKVVVP